MKRSRLPAAYWPMDSEYRLPKIILQKEIKRIENAGVVIHLNTTVGKDITFDGLQAKHGALYVATGTQFSKELGVPGEDWKVFATVWISCRALI